LTIYNIYGKIIRNLLNQNEIAGSRSILWNGEDNFGTKVSSGTYIYSIETGDYSEVRKMVLLK
jgi:flagellar hook assembly protein FlgD